MFIYLYVDINMSKMSSLEKIKNDINMLKNENVDIPNSLLNLYELVAISVRRNERLQR